MSAVAKFLQGKVDESLTKFVQPAGLVPAALLVLLNLAFVYPELKTAEFSLATSFGDLDGTWQTVAAGISVIFVGYVLLSMSSNVLDLLSGDLWRGSTLYGFLSRRARNGLKVRSMPAQVAGLGSLEKLGEVWDLRVAYPIGGTPGEMLCDVDVADVGPTRLGNAVRATHKLIYDRYRIDLAALWPQLEASSDKDSVAMKAATDAKASLDTLANTTFVLGAFAVEGLLLYSAQGNWTGALLSTLAFPVAYVTYRGAVAKASAWGDSIESVVDLNRENCARASTCVSTRRRRTSGNSGTRLHASSSGGGATMKMTKSSMAPRHPQRQRSPHRAMSVSPAMARPLPTSPAWAPRQTAALPRSSSTPW